jgi:hypothetical protein
LLEVLACGLANVLSPHPDILFSSQAHF